MLLFNNIEKIEEVVENKTFKNPYIIFLEKGKIIEDDYIDFDEERARIKDLTLLEKINNYCSTQ